jgi:hypothetical protein
LEGIVATVSQLFAQHSKSLDVKHQDLRKITNLYEMLGLGLFVTFFTLVLVFRVKLANFESFLDAGF